MASLDGASLPMNDLLERLLVDRRWLDAFLADDPSLALDRAQAEALSTIDREQLVATADRMREDLLKRQYSGSGGLLKLFPKTIDGWRTDHPADERLMVLMDAFMASDAWLDYRELPWAGEGACLEEAFFRFCDSGDIGDARDREAEFLGAVTKAVGLCPAPAFRIPRELRPARAGWFAVSTRAPIPTLYAAVAGRVVAGPITPFLAALLSRPDEGEVVAEEHAVDPGVLSAARIQLRGLGLL